MTLGTLLREARKRAGLSLREVEKRAGISNGYLSLLESGNAKRPSPHYLHALAEVYGASYALLMELAGYVAPAPPPAATESLDGLADLSAAELQQVRAFAGFLRASRAGDADQGGQKGRE